VHSPSRFALIARAEAAELPPPKVHPREPENGARPPVRQMPPRVAAAASAPAGRIFVQAGAFSMRDNAQRVQSRIARLGNAQVTTASVNGVELYRVRLGPFDSEAKAHQLLARIVDSGYPGARIVGD